MDGKGKLLVELKARYEDLGKARALLAGAQHIGTFRQIDNYFALGERRLKLRAVEGANDAQLIYYERPDRAEVKESRVLIADVSDGAVVREILSRVLPVKAEVRKTREVYRFQGVQVHLDAVVGLGKFIEFEKVVSGESERGAAHAELESLARYFQIPVEDLMSASYSDLLEPG